MGEAGPKRGMMRPPAWDFFRIRTGGRGGGDTRGEFCPGKLTLGKILFEISGQYFYQGFKPRARIFPTVFKKSPISSSHRLKI